MPIAVLACPSCRVSLQIAAEAVGRPVRCSRCGRVFVPMSSETVAQDDRALTAAPRGTTASRPPVSAGSKPARLDPDATKAPSQTNGVAPAAADSGGRPSVPGYEVLGVLGQGGMGVVYKAKQRGLNRVVALKMILHAEHAGPEQRRRFRAEAEAVARLQHPNIVQVYEVGEHNGLPYFSLEFCPGGSLADRLDGTPLPPAEAARLVQTLAVAMQAAHKAGIVHRDLKPANVLLAEDGTPKVTDFGLAKKLDVQGQTHTGAVMGTPAYMAPEQALGEKDVGPAADVYALGVILYELLTGRPPFRATSVMDTLLQVVSDEPVPPSQLQSKTPRDLETISLKCLHKEPGKRYDSAEALAADLGRYQRGEPIAARPVGRVERSWRWCRRNPGVASMTAAVAVVLVASSLVAWGLAGWALSEKGRADEQTRIAEGRADDAVRESQRADEQTKIARGKEAESLRESQRANRNADEAKRREEEAQREKKAAEDARDLAELRLYASKLAQAQREWLDNNAGAAFQLLAETRPDPRDVEYRHLWVLFNSNQHILKGHTGFVVSVCFSPDGTRIVSGSHDGTARVWDANTGREVLTLKRQRSLVRSVCFSPDGRRIVSGGSDGTVRVWDAERGQEILTLKGHTNWVNSVCFSPDGKRILSGSQDRTLRIWDADRGQELLTLKGHEGSVNSVCFSPDGQRFLSGSLDGTLKVWDADKKSEIRTDGPGDLSRPATSGGLTP